MSAVDLSGQQDHSGPESDQGSTASDSTAPVDPWKALLPKVLRYVESRPWLVAGYLALIVMLKLLTIAHGNAPTAVMVLGGSGYAGLVSVVILVVIPGAALAVFCTAIITTGVVWGGKGRDEAKVAAGQTLLIGVAAAVFLTVAELVVFTAVSLVFGGVAALWYRRKRNNGGIDVPDFLTMIAITAAIGLLCGAFLVNMWLPVERFDLEDTDEALVGYVIAEDADELTVLIEADRTTKVIQADTIDERSRCQLKPAWVERRLFMATPGTYPDCPKG